MPGPGGELHGGQHVRDELTQVGHRGVHQSQVPVIAGQPLPAGLPRRPHPLTADVPAQPRADLVVAYARVEHDLQDVVQQRLPVLAAAGPLGEGLGQPLPRGCLPPGQRLVEQQQHLVQHVDRGLRDQGEQDRVLAVIVAPRQILRRQPSAHPGEEPAPPGRQHRQVQRVRVHPAQVGQLLQLGLHRRRGRRDGTGAQPRQSGAAQDRVNRQHPVQLGAPPLGQHRGQARPGLFPCLLTGGCDTLQDADHARPHEAGRGQVLARLPEQQLRRVVLHCPREQELLQVLPARPVDLVPAEISGNVPQVIGAGLPASAVAAQLADRDAQSLRQPRHRGSRASATSSGTNPSHGKVRGRSNNGTASGVSGLLGYHHWSFCWSWLG